MNRAERESFYELMRLGQRLETRVRNKLSSRYSEALMKWYFIVTIVTPFGVACVFAVIKYFLPDVQIVNTVGLWSLVISYLFAMLQPFVWFILNARTIRSFLVEPTKSILINLNVKTMIDVKLLRMMKKYSKEQLELCSLELKVEKEHIEKRTSLIAGSIEKIGLAPGALAISISIFGNDYGDWTTALAYVVMLFYVCALIAHFLVMRLDRFIRIVEMAIKTKECE
ncbi:MAG: hypothetical protein WA987_11180 [Cellvibrio sp.]